MAVLSSVDDSQPDEAEQWTESLYDWKYSLVARDANKVDVVLHYSIKYTLHAFKPWGLSDGSL